MDLRARIAAALRTAQTEGDLRRAATLRLVMATIRDRDLTRRSQREEGAELSGADTAEIRAILAQLAAQRRDSAAAFEQAGRLEQALDKTAEAEAIEAFLPRRMTDREIDGLIAGTVTRLDAHSLRDMGRVMSSLRPKLADQLPVADLRARVRRHLDPPG